MRCLSCNGPLEYAGGGAYARCTHCLALFGVQNRQLTPIQVQAPGGGNDPRFNAMYAQQLGFAPREATHAAFNVGGVGLKVNTQQIKNRISGWIWGLVLGGVIFLAAAIILLWVFLKTKSAIDQTYDAVASASAPKQITWDGKSALTCNATDHVKAEKITANISSGNAISANGDCVVDLVDVNITAPTAISAMGNARVNVKGGSIKGTQNAVSALGNAEVTFTGTKVDGKKEKLGAAKITGP